MTGELQARLGSGSVVEGNMFGGRHEAQVLKAIIEAVAVDVVYDMTFRDRPVRLFPHEPVEVVRAPVMFRRPIFAKDVRVSRVRTVPTSYATARVPALGTKSARLQFPRECQPFSVRQPVGSAYGKELLSSLLIMPPPTFRCGYLVSLTFRFIADSAACAKASLATLQAGATLPSLFHAIHFTIGSQCKTTI
jgi:hypothetical protein